MRKCTLIRTPSTDQGTLGKIYTDTGKSWFTLELPWLDNASNISCIPLGTYIVKWTLSPRLKKFTYEITEVKKRGGIRIHGGNVAGMKPQYISHSLGCPLLGKKVGMMRGQLAVFLSQVAVKEFVSEMGRQSFILEVRNA